MRGLVLETSFKLPSLDQNSEPSRAYYYQKEYPNRTQLSHHLKDIKSRVFKYNMMWPVLCSIMKAFNKSSLIEKGVSSGRKLLANDLSYWP